MVNIKVEYSVPKDVNIKIEYSVPKRVNPWQVFLNGNEYILGRYIHFTKKGKEKFFTILISAESGNRWAEPVEVTEEIWMHIQDGNSRSIKEHIEKIVKTAK